MNRRNMMIGTTLTAFLPMLGKLAILAQRARAERALGEFDIREFHDAMLLPGDLPLELLERIYR